MKKGERKIPVSSHLHEKEGGTYVPLWCKSNYSFLEGASHPEELVREAARLSLPALAITDRNGVYGAVRAHMAAKEHGMKLLIGAEIECATSTGRRSRFVLLARSRTGYARLCRMLTLGHRAAEKGFFGLKIAGLLAAAGDLIAMIDGTLTDSPIELDQMRSAFEGNLYVRISRHGIAEENEEESRRRALARACDLPLVAVNEVLYHTPSRRPLQDVMTCIRHGKKIDEAGVLLKPNDEFGLKSGEEFRKVFADDTASCTRTLEIADLCEFRLDEIRYRYPGGRLAEGATESSCLRELTLNGARERYGEDVPEESLLQIESELALIDELDYGGYFLTMKEIVDYCRARDILCQGRGSAANSIVCYCLGITAIDPVRMDLLFERFLSRERREPPDIDLDIEHERREEVIQHVYSLYGRDHAAMVANVIRYRTRSAIREVGKVFGMPETLLGKIAKFAGSRGEVNQIDLSHVRHEMFPSDKRRKEEMLQTEDAREFMLLKHVKEIIDFPRHLSIHPGGFLLGHEPVHDLVPIENGSMEDRTVIQWDKQDIEDLGLFKVDLLGLGALTMLHRALELIAKHHEHHYTLATIPAEDSETYDMICRADTIGVFQIESRAQMAMLPRLLPRNFHDLVIEISMIRPGPITGGMVHPYLRRRRGEEPVEYPHPLLEPVLRKTLGIPLFQEQVMKLAMVAADYTPGEGDGLRRDMAAWRQKGRIEAHRERLISRMKAKGIPAEFAERVFEQIRGFGEYGFPESHAASFALIVYATAWLRCHYPVEFTCAILNAQPMGFYSPATIIDDAKRHGVVFGGIDAARSAWDCTVEEISDHQSRCPEKSATGVRIGLRYVKGLSRDAGRRIVEERARKPFESLEDFFLRVKPDEGALRRLASAGAFQGFGGTRRDGLWSVLGMAGRRDRSMSLRERTLPLFDALDESSEVSWDYATTGHSIRAHPLAALRGELTRRGFPSAAEIKEAPDGSTLCYAGFVICRQHPGTAKGVTFLTMEDETGFVNVVIWKKIFDRFASLVKETSFLSVSGKIQSQFGVVHLIAQKMRRFDVGPDRLMIPSRDFR